MHHVLHLLDDPGEAIVDAARLLRAGRPAAGRRLRPARARVPARAPRPPPARHRRRGDVRLGREAGLEVETERSLLPPAAPAERAADRAALAAARARRAPRAQRRWRDGGGLLRVLPAAHRRGATSSCGRRSTASRALEPALRLGDLWRRRQRRATARRSRRCARSARARALSVAGHLTCVGPHARGGRRARSPATGRRGCATSSPCAATCPSPGRRSRRTREGYASSVELIEAVRAARAVRGQRRRLPRAPPRVALAAGGPRPARAQGRGRGDARDHAVLLRAPTRSCALRDRVARAGIGLPIVPGIMLATNFAASRRMAARCGASVPGLAGGALRGPRRRSRDAQAGRRDRRRRAGRGAPARGLRGRSTSTRSTGPTSSARVCRLLDVRPRDTRGAGGMTDEHDREARIAALHDAAAASASSSSTASWGAQIQELGADRGGVPRRALRRRIRSRCAATPTCCA